MYGTLYYSSKSGIYRVFQNSYFRLLDTIDGDLVDTFFYKDPMSGDVSFGRKGSLKIESISDLRYIQDVPEFLLQASGCYRWRLIIYIFYKDPMSGDVSFGRKVSLKIELISDLPFHCKHK